MILVSFQIENKLGKARFFQKIFLLADIIVKIVLRILLLIFSYAEIQFTKKKLTWRSYTTAKTLPTYRQVKLINMKEFSKVAIDENP